MAELTADMAKIIKSHIGICDMNSGVHEIYTPGVAWKPEDIFALQEVYYSCDPLKVEDDTGYLKCLNDRGLYLHLTVHPNRICWRSGGEVANTIFKDQLGDTCTSILTGDEGEKKCDALKEVVGKYASENIYWAIGKYVGGGISGFAFMVFGFGYGVPALSEWRANRNNRKKDPPDPPPCGVGVSSGAPGDTAVAASGETPEAERSSIAETMEAKAAITAAAAAASEAVWRMMESIPFELESVKPPAPSYEPQVEEHTPWYYDPLAVVAIVGGTIAVVVLSVDDLSGVGVADDAAIPACVSAVVWGFMVFE